MESLAQQNPAGRVDVALSRLIERLVQKSGNPILLLVHEGLRPDLDAFLNHHLGPQALPLPDPEVMRFMFEAAVRMRQQEIEREIQRQQAAQQQQQDQQRQAPQRPAPQEGVHARTG